MKREILFKGLRSDGKGWVYGSLHEVVGNGSIRNRTANPPYFEDKPQEFKLYYILERRLPGDIGWDISDTFVSHHVMPETICQYTGQKDKNGKMIFEGDKVNSAYFENATVMFWHNGWYFETRDYTHHSMNTASHSFEVIRNIHDNG